MRLNRLALFRKETIMPYKFPVANKFAARAVTELDFEIDPMDPEVYVDLDAVRGRTYLDRIKYNLNIDKDRLADTTEDFTKILFSGHRGTGKSMELKRFQHYIDHNDRYFSVFIEIEKESEVGTFQSEDLFAILIVKLIEKIDQHHIDFRSDFLNDIFNEWFSDEDIKKELKQNFKVDLGTETGAGWDFFGFVKLKAAMKAIFSSESNTCKTIRQSIKKNPLRLIERFNASLSDLRDTLEKQKRAKDILFILDGTEKISHATYLKLFRDDSHLIRSIDANMIVSVPINSFFDINKTASSQFFQAFTLPMIVIDEKSSPLLEKIITTRIDADTFIGPDALQFCVEKSGGCIRQLIRIVNKALNISLGEKITPEIARDAASEISRSMMDILDSEHREILRARKFDTADEKLLELLFELVILKYNGERKINPLIEDKVT